MSRARGRAPASIATALDGFPLRDAARLGRRAADRRCSPLVAPLVALRFGASLGRRRGCVGASRSTSSSRSSRSTAASILAVVPPLAAARRRAGRRAARSHARASRPAINRLLDRSARARGNQRTRRLRALLLLVARSASSRSTLLAEADNALRRLDLATVDYALQRARRGAAAGRRRGRRDRRQDAQRRPEADVPVRRATARATSIRNLTKAGAEVIAFDVQFTEPSAGREGGQRADRGGARRRQRRPVHDRGRLGRRRRAVLRFGKGLGVQPAACRRSRSSIKDADGSVRRMLFGKQGLEFPIAAARGQARAPDRRARGPTARGSTSRARPTRSRT